MKRRHLIVRIRNRICFIVGLPVDALFAAVRACNPNTWRT